MCELWKNYLVQQRIWQKCVESYAKRFLLRGIIYSVVKWYLRFPLYFQQVGWWKLVPGLGGEKLVDPLVYKQTYWKMTNLSNSWSNRSR